MSKLDLKNGGENTCITKIRPSARKSIHYFRETMERLNSGLKARSTNSASSHDGAGDGCDEVDNIWSKPVHPVPQIRRNSFQCNDRYSESSPDSEGEMSKSLPTYYLQSKTYSSEEDDLGLSPTRSANNSYNSSQESNPFGTPQSFRSERNWRNYSKERSAREDVKAQESSSNVSNYLAVIILLGAVLSVYFFSSEILSNKNVFLKKHQYDELRFSEDMDALGVKYNLNDDSILQVLAGITTIRKKEIAGSFIFVYNSKKKSFDEKHFNDIVDNIASASAKYLRNESASVQHVVLEGWALREREHGELLRAHREQVAARGVLLVRRVERVPAALAMAFHYYCDEYDPFIKSSAIFFTLDLDSCSPSGDEESIHAVLERCLAGKWRALRPDNVGPLLARVVSVVVDFS